MARNLPQQHGAEILDDPNVERSIRGAPDTSDADEHGGRKHN